MELVLKRLIATSPHHLVSQRTDERTSSLRQKFRYCCEQQRQSLHIFTALAHVPPQHHQLVTTLILSKIFS